MTEADGFSRIHVLHQFIEKSMPMIEDAPSNPRELKDLKKQIETYWARSHNPNPILKKIPVLAKAPKPKRPSKVK